MSEEPDRIYDPRRVEPVTWDVAAPKRVSVTLVKKADACPRDAAFYLRYGGGAQTGPLLRGSLFHLFAEKAMSMLMVHGERTLFAAQEGEDPVLAAQEVSQTTKEWVDELVEETGWPVCEADVDDVREMAYHFAVGNDVDPETVIACERKFVLETPDGTLSGKVDLAALPPDGVLDVVDYKSSFAVPPQDDFDRMVQVPLYAVLILWGNPVEKRTCLDCAGRGWRPIEGTFQYAVDALEDPTKRVPCPTCDGRGSVEEVLPPLGLDEVQWVRARQVYPRFLRDGVMSYRERTIGRADLRDALAAAQRAMRRDQPRDGDAGVAGGVGGALLGVHVRGGVSVAAAAAQVRGGYQHGRAGGGGDGVVGASVVAGGCDADGGREVRQGARGARGGVGGRKPGLLAAGVALDGGQAVEGSVGLGWAARRGAGGGGVR
jgi:hypothetical protein